MLAHIHHVLLFREVSAVDDHAAAGDGEGEEGLAHGPDPDHGVLQSLPAGGEHETVALRRAGQEGHPRRQHQEDEEEEGHHHLVGLLDAVGPQEEGQKRPHHHDDVVGDHGVGRGGEGPEPLRGVRRQEGAEDGVHQGLQNVGHDDGVADGDAEGARERQPAQDAAGLAHGLAPGSPGVLIGPQGAGSRPAAHGELRRKAHIAEDGDEQEVDQKEGTAAVAAHLIGEAPDVGHTHRGTHRRQDEAPAAGKALGLRVLVHVVPSLRRDAPGSFFSIQERARFRAPLPRRFPQRGFFILKLCREKVKGWSGKIPERPTFFGKCVRAAHPGGPDGKSLRFFGGEHGKRRSPQMADKGKGFTPPPPAPGP